MIILILIFFIFHLTFLTFQTLLIWYVYGDVYEVKIPSKPQKPIVLSIMEDLMDKFLYKLSLPSVQAHDVVKRELHVMINGGEPVVHMIEDVSVAVYELTFEQDQEVNIHLVDIDDADNRSPKSEMLCCHSS